MAKLDPTKFRVSSALKTIIGKELITDDFIAVFELVKNAFDAHAKRVDIIFENLYPDNPKQIPRLIIKDNGKGMDLTDIVEKWLFVAYSAKKEGTEDYRDKIHSKRIQAGAKGIGRFSCDKLGSHLALYTKKRGAKSTINKIVINWKDFEKDSKQQFVEIPIKYSYVKNIPYDSFKKGTILEITGLRENWDRPKLLKLRQSLEKLINPNQENDPKGFSIFLNAEEELINDLESKKKGKDTKVINGRIDNKIFEDLEIKTSKIDTSISDNGTIIETKLEDKGSLIYQIKEKNIFKDLLGNIRITLFFLNQSAKLTFNKKMGMPAVEYGSVFLYKNGFRIYPFGEEGADPLKIDRRKGQGYARFLGTREIIGRIEINGINEEFKETSSRDGGLIKNENYVALEKYFYDYALKRLEKYVNEVIKWGKFGELEELRKQDPKAIKKQIADIVLNLTNSKELLDLNYDSRFVDILEDRTEKNLNKVLINLKRLAEQTSSDLVLKEIKRVERKYNSLLKAKEEAEAEAKEAREETEKAKGMVEQLETQNIFLKSAIPRDAKFLDNLCHSIAMYSDAMGDDIRDVLQEIRRNKIRKNVIYDAIKNISYHTNTISSLSKFATRANFRIKFAKNKKDLVVFIREHLVNVASGFYKKEIKILFKQGIDRKFFCEFRPIEITMLLDNLISNSMKNKAKLFKAEILSLTPQVFEISFTDDGKGVHKSVEKTLFEEGITTTKGSGLGLFHVKEILSEMNSEIEYNKEYRKGAQFVVTFRKSL